MKHAVLTYDRLSVPVSRLGSYLAWREILPEGKITPPPTGEAGTCALCGGTYEPVHDPEYGLIRCLCETWAEQQRLEKVLAPYRSLYTPKDLESFEIWGSAEDRKRYRIFLDYLRDWRRWPEDWFIVSGDPGTGKTHLMVALAEHFYPWALYISAADFEQHIFEALEDNTLNEMVDTIRHAPILLYDDLGSEYVATGRDFVRSNLRKIIDFRYQMYQEYPTGVSTNLEGDRLDLYDRRIADRLMDGSKSNLIRFLGKSWRRQNVG